jgi:hypothetical protein
MEERLLHFRMKDGSRQEVDGRRVTLLPPAIGIANQLDDHGFTILSAVISSKAVGQLVEAVGAARPADAAARVKGDRVYALRNLLTVPAMQELADSPAVRRLVEPVLGPAARVVRGLLFDKTPGANWKVAWHQDLSIAVRRRVEIAGFGPWSIKAGVPHVQPPVGVLRDMLAIRLHLDDCGPDNGPLRVLPGSHAEGVLSPEQVEAWRRRVPPVACCVPAGGAMLMRPLLLHASSPAVTPGHRRVIHLEYGGGDLPGDLEWEAAD